ncbi:phytoene desaturase family protein [Botrimarina hoheduenensis]|uniref:All-trans-zeta-carotene desaturase n=1 Tax=Botrimarina hoheduenensis TaxID=2528000 RepID=A0A5C5W053_9BACT|nr:phytoene desaturase family protein [Botrimarina hoheduenensis]TWT43142.1 All-trans-zeta-carotene desaturase [Botrimarina hoheduenensis]
MVQSASNQEVAIVGAGPGGLAAAMLLAARGCKVRVFERHTTPGGRTSSLEADGFRWDLGPTFFLYPRILSEIFAECGRDLMTETPMTRLDPQYRLVFGEGPQQRPGVLDATPNIERMEAEIARLSPSDAGAFRRFLVENRNKLAAFTPILESPFYKLTDLLRPEVLRSAHLVRPWRSLYREVGRYFNDPRLQLAFTFQGKYLGMSPFQCPSLFSILAFLEYEHGVFHPTGGCGQVSRRMAEIVTEMGGEVRLGEPIEQLRFAGRRVTGVQTARGEYPVDSLVINADFAQTMTELTPNHLRKRWTDEKLAKKRYSCSTFMMYLGLDGELPGLAHHTIYLAPDYKKNLTDIERGNPLDDDCSVYVQAATQTDASLAPPGCSSLYVLVPTPNLGVSRGKIDWATETPRMRRIVFDQLKELGVENAEARLRTERIVTPDDWLAQHHIYRGATFNLAHSLDQMLYWRPHNRFEDLEGVYLVGGGTHPGSGLPTIYSSARIACDTLMEDLGIASAA